VLISSTSYSQLSAVPVCVWILVFQLPETFPAADIPAQSTGCSHISFVFDRCPRCDFSTLRFDKLKDHLHKQHNVGSAPERRMRITDLVNQSQSNDLPAQQQSQAATASDGSGVVPGAEAKLPASPSSAQGVMYADSLQMVQLPEGMTLVNGGVSLMSAPEGHTIAILQDQAIVLRPSAEFVSPADFPPLQLIALGGDEQTVVSGIAQALVNETVGSCIVKDESEPCHFVV
jgi:hypothetical protein